MTFFIKSSEGRGQSRQRANAADGSISARGTLQVEDASGNARDAGVFAVTAKGGHKLQQAKDARGNPILTLPPPEQDPMKKTVAGMRKTYSSQAEMMRRFLRILLHHGSRSGHELNGKAMSMNQLATALYSLADGAK